VRLNRLLARSGVASRRKCDALIREGQVSVNGRVVNEPWLDVDPSTDRIEVGGKPVEGIRSHSYLLLHKPAGVITTVTDPRQRRTVIDLLGTAARGRRLYPVGRLDADTTGALLLTDDGELAFRLTHPRYGIRKEYVVEVTRPVPAREAEEMLTGVDLEDGVVHPDSVRSLADGRLLVVLHEGRKRVVRRMMEARGHRVVHLHRRRFAGISADDLARGKWRELKLTEVNTLREMVGLEPISRKEP
jgi:23S rRNA pseudouridine2605 synthase